MDEKHRGGNRLKVENIGDGKGKEEQKSQIRVEY